MHWLRDSSVTWFSPLVMELEAVSAERLPAYLPGKLFPSADTGSGGSVLRTFRSPSTPHSQQHQQQNHHHHTHQCHRTTTANRLGNGLGASLLSKALEVQFTFRPSNFDRSSWSTVAFSRGGKDWRGGRCASHNIIPSQVSARIQRKTHRHGLPHPHA